MLDGLHAGMLQLIACESWCGTARRAAAARPACARPSRVEAERASDGPVFLADTDPQGTLSTWHEARQAETPARIDVALSASCRSRGHARSWRRSLLHRHRAQPRRRECSPVPARGPGAGAGAALAGGSVGSRCDRGTAQPDRAPVPVRAQPGDAERQHHRRGSSSPVPPRAGCPDHHSEPCRLSRRHDGRTPRPS
jgi:hypothetical protein